MPSFGVSFHFTEFGGKIKTRKPIRVLSCNFSYHEHTESLNSNTLLAYASPWFFSHSFLIVSLFFSHSAAKILSISFSNSSLSFTNSALITAVVFISHSFRTPSAALCHFKSDYAFIFCSVFMAVSICSKSLVPSAASFEPGCFSVNVFNDALALA